MQFGQLINQRLRTRIFPFKAAEFIVFSVERNAGKVGASSFVSVWLAVRER